VNSRLHPLLDAAFATARAGHVPEGDASLLISLLRRYRSRGNRAALASDNEMLALVFGPDAARIRVTRHDVRELLDLVLSELDLLPPRSSVIANVVAAPEDDQAIPAVLAVLKQFEGGVTDEEERHSLRALLTALREHGADARVAAALQPWSFDLTEAGDRAREALGEARYGTSGWLARARSWHSLDDVADHVADAVATGWNGALPITAVSYLLERAHAKRGGDREAVALIDEYLGYLGPGLSGLDVSPEEARALVERVWREAPDEPWTVDPLATILLAVPTDVAAPYLVELLVRNEPRSGLYADQTGHAIRQALAAHAGGASPERGW